MEDVQVAAAAYCFISAHSHVTERRAMCSRVARVGTRASFDAEQKKPTSNASSIALGPNAEH
jgi:hypothetical protein